MIRTLANRLRAWRRARYWTPERQIEKLRAHLQLDARWLAHDRTAAALLSRYADIAAPDWYQRPLEDVGALRDRLGLNPHRRICDIKAEPAAIDRLAAELQQASDVAARASTQAVRYFKEAGDLREQLQRETRRSDFLRRQLDVIAEQNAELRREHVGGYRPIAPLDLDGHSPKAPPKNP